MQIVENGSGRPLVLIPGIQGRWEYARPAVDALSTWFRVITFPLGDEPSSGFPWEAAHGFDNYPDQLTRALDQTGVDRATICGISFGGLIALRFAAAHPERTSALVLASTPGPSWRLRKRHEIYARWPWAIGPLFVAEAPSRLRAEISAAFGERIPRRRFIRSQLGTLLQAPLSLQRMGGRALLISSCGAAANAARVTAPTLVITGEPELDHVVAADGSAEYLGLIPTASSVVLERTGHLGSITKPDAFAGLIRDFVNGQRHAAA